MKPMVGRGAPTRAAVAIAILVPIGLFTLSYQVWWISRLLGLGPFDRATFGWLFVVPAWCLSSVIAGLLWARLRLASPAISAVVVAAAITVVVAALLWMSYDASVCTFGRRTSPTVVIVYAVFVGLVIGSGSGAGALLTQSLAVRGHSWLAILGGSVLALGVFFVTMYVVAYGSLVIGGCNRPP
jgi:hypothetical protein